MKIQKLGQNIFIKYNNIEHYQPSINKNIEIIVHDVFHKFGTEVRNVHNLL